jgi:hypothetical protein
MVIQLEFPGNGGKRSLLTLSRVVWIRAGAKGEYRETGLAAMLTGGMMPAQLVRYAGEIMEEN